MSGPLEGLVVVELAGIGPGPYAAMLLADLGAQVVRVERPGEDSGVVAVGHRFLLRGRVRLGVDLATPEGAAVVLALVERADALVEGFRPGVAERLGVGPRECLARNPRLVYGRMTGWGQDGPWAGHVGHDLNYIALTGLLHAVGEAGGPPVAPLNVAGDFGGGGTLLALGVVAGILRARLTGQGDVVDAAIVDGVASLLAMTYALHGAGLWQDRRGVNLLDGGAPFYAVYPCADGRYVAVAAIEERFYAALLAGLDLADDPVCVRRDDVTGWPALRAALAARFAERTRDEWCAHFEGSSACVTPVLSLAEAPSHPHLAARGTFVASAGGPQPAAVPRFARAARPAATGPVVAEDPVAALAALGLGDVEGLVERGVVHLPDPDRA